MKKNKAFTLIELLLVVLLLGVVVGFSLPNFSHAYERFQLSQSAEDLAYLIRYAQSRAIMKRTTLQLILDSVSQRYWLMQKEASDLKANSSKDVFKRIPGRWGHIVRLPEKISLKVEKADQREMKFYPDGKMDRIRISVSGTKEYFIVSTKEQSGSVYVFEPQSLQ